MQPPNARANDDLWMRRPTALRVSLDDFISRYPKKTFKEGETLLLKDEIPKFVYIIESGKVKTYMIDTDGCERLISFHAKKESLPIGFAFCLTNRSQFFYEAYTDCEVRLVPRGDFISYLDANPRSLQMLYVGVTKQLMSMMNRINSLEQPRALKRIASSLLHLPDALGLNKRPHKPKLKLSITQQEIANLLGLTRETTSIELKKLQRMKLINYSRNSYNLHMERLRKFVNGDKS